MTLDIESNTAYKLQTRARARVYVEQKGNTSLHISSLAGHTNVVQVLLQYGARVNLQSSVGLTHALCLSVCLSVCIVVLTEEDFQIDSEVRCEGAHPLCDALSRRRLIRLS